MSECFDIVVDLKECAADYDIEGKIGQDIRQLQKDLKCLWVLDSAMWERLQDIVWRLPAPCPRFCKAMSQTLQIYCQIFKLTGSYLCDAVRLHLAAESTPDRIIDACMLEANREGHRTVQTFQLVLTACSITMDLYYVDQGKFCPVEMIDEEGLVVLVPRQRRYVMWPFINANGDTEISYLAHTTDEALKIV